MSLFVLDDMIVDESGGDSHENKRVKITTACDTCRRRKVKCDGESPCANCQRGSYQCTFSDATAKRPRGPPKGFVALIEDRLHTIESLLVNLVNKDNATDISSLTKDIKRERLDSTSIEESSPTSQQRFNTFKIHQYSPSLTTQHNRLFTSTPSSDVSDVSHNPGYADEMTNEDDEILLNNLIHPSASNTLQSNNLSFLMLDGQNSKPSNNNNNNGNYVEPPLPTLPNLKPIPEEISKPLFEKYFNHIHPYFPIINRGHFFRLLSNSNVENHPSKLLIEAICAIGAMFPPIVKQNSEYSSQFFYERAKSLLDHFIDVPRLSTIQALILLYMVDQGKPSSYRSQTHSSIAIKMAQTIGLNRKNGTAYQGAKDRQTKKLVWWGCFVLDRLNSLSTGDPLIINDKMCDIDLPSPDEMDELDQDNINFQNNIETQSSSSASHSFTYKQHINTFISFIRMTKLTGQILEHLQTTSCVGLKASWNHHAIINIFETLLSDWLRELPPYLNYVPSPSTNFLPLPGQIANIHMHHQTLYLLLHYPYIAEYDKLRKGDRSIRTSKTFVKSMNICNTAAHTITQIGVEALDNVYTCVTFPAMFYCLGKAAKVHSINILSQQRGLAINSYKNIIKTIKICKFYKQNNIMKELAQKTIQLLEAILIKYQDKFSHEEIFGVTPSGEIVNPDGLSLTLSCLNGVGNSSSNSSSIGPIMTSIKLSPTSQIYSESFGGANNNAKSVNSIILQTSSSTDISSHKRNSPTSQIQQSINFIQGDNEGNRNQQFVPVNITSPFTDSFAMPMSPQIITTTPSNGQQYWADMGIFNNDNSSYDHMTPTTTSANQTPSIASSQTNYFSPSQSQRTQSLPISTSSQIDQFTSNTFKSNSLSSHSRSNQMSIESIEQEIYTSPNSSPSSQQSQRYVFMDMNENENNSFTSENKNNFAISEASIYDDDNSRISFHNSSSTNKTTYKILNEILTTTTTPTSSQSRMTSPSSSSSSLNENEIQINNVFAGELYFGTTNELDAITVLSKRIGNCGVKTPPNVDTSIGIEYGGIDNDFNNSVTMSVDVGYGFGGFENGGI